MKKETLAKLIDHTLLAQTATEKDIKKLCEEAKKYDFKSVCVNPIFVSFCANELKDSDVSVCTVIGFPLGATTTEDKAAEAKQAIKNGADEVDMVINVGEALENKFDLIENDISAVVCSAKNEGNLKNKKIIVKVILETCFLSDETIIECSKRAVSAGADFVKTSTGFATLKDASGKLLPNGATAHHVEIMRKAVGKNFGVKASGGIRSAKTAAEMLKAGANRLGTSSGVKILEEWEE